MIADSMHTTTRPGLPWGGFSFSHVPMPSSSFPPLVGPPTARRRHFCARIQRGRGEAKTQNLRKGHLQARRAVFNVRQWSLYSLTAKLLAEANRSPMKRKRVTPNEYQSSDATLLCLTHGPAETDTSAVCYTRLYCIMFWVVWQALAHARNKSTPAHSIRSKPGRYYLLHSYQTRNTNNIITHAIADKSIIAYITLIIYSGRWIAPRSVPPSDRTRHKHF